MKKKPGKHVSSFAVSEEQHDEMKRDAKRLGLNLSEFIRELHDIYKEFKKEIHKRWSKKNTR